MMTNFYDTSLSSIQLFFNIQFSEDYSTAIRQKNWLSKNSKIFYWPFGQIDNHATILKLKEDLI